MNSNEEVIFIFYLFFLVYYAQVGCGLEMKFKIESD